MSNWTTELNNEQKQIAIARLSALWAFAECGLGGMMHLLHSPFTGLVVGGFAMIILCLLCLLANYSASKILKSLVLVLIIKFSLSPQSPFTAYIAVCFQALMAIVIFKIFKANLFSIFLFCIICMLESALQKLLVLTIIFGKALWVSVDEFVKFILSQFHYNINQASIWIIATYILIYITGGFIVAFIANAVIKTRPNTETKVDYFIAEFKKEDKLKRLKKIVYFLISIGLIAAGFLLAGNNIKSTTAKITEVIVYALCMIILIQFVLNYVVKFILKRLLHKSQSKYSRELNEMIDFFPNFKIIIQQSRVLVRGKKGLNKVKIFVINVIHQSIIF